MFGEQVGEGGREMKHTLEVEGEKHSTGKAGTAHTKQNHSWKKSNENKYIKYENGRIRSLLTECKNSPHYLFIFSKV